jgi:5-formyltetrahydrofolate cyclo-ligase
MISEIKSLEELAPGTMGIPEPQKEFLRPVRWTDIEAVMVPALAYDLNGFRLGYGGGYYDRLLSGISPECTKIGAAFEQQIVSEVPREKHDIKVDLIITEDRVIYT